MMNYSIDKKLAQKIEENYSFLTIGTFFRYYLSSLESPHFIHSEYFLKSDPTFIAPERNCTGCSEFMMQTETRK